MNIVMYAAGIPFNGETINQRSLGGSESACYYVAKELAERGHEVTVFTESKDEGRFDDVQYCFLGERTQRAPLGDRWHFFSENTPHDVSIVQRHPMAFMRPIQAKLCLFWAHDICLRRNNDPFMAGLWQTNVVMPVSNWFKEQMCSVWTVNPEIVKPIHNGVDYTLFDRFELKANHLGGPDKVNLIYCSRPERGLQNLVDVDGIMDQLKDKVPNVHLYVCGYQHDVPAMKDFYDFLNKRVEELPNCTNLGALTKEQLYEKMCTEMDAWVYPTEFEEVSCITAMECMAAGLYIFTTNIGALPETIGNYQNAILFDAKAGVPNDRFVERIAAFNGKYRRKPNKPYSWDRTVDEIEEIIEDEFAACTSNKDAVARHLLRNSDIAALKLLAANDANIAPEVTEQLDLYAFSQDRTKYAEHYASGTAEMYETEGWKYEENFDSHPRYQAVASKLKDIKDGHAVVDYGCAHGHFTNYLARQFPELSFVGIDVSPKAIEIAKAKAEEWKLANVQFQVDDWLNVVEGQHYPCDVLILGEILEHVPDQTHFMNKVQCLVGACEVVMTTPMGPWEEMSYQKEYPRRYHLHHIERQDLQEMFRHNEHFNITCLPAGHSVDNSVIGWYVTTFSMGDGLETPAVAHDIDYERKLAQLRPRETVSFCGIVKDGELSLRRMLESVAPWVDEVIIGVDRTTTDRTIQLIHQFSQDLEDRHRTPRLPVKVIDIDSPVQIGFDAARNETLKHARHDWIMWGDADEYFVGGERLPKFLRRNNWDGYGIAQHHFSVEPTMVLSTDFPVRLFRRKPEVQFLGVVHEHPEHKGKLNQGVGFAWVNHGLHFAHGGYSTEEVRRLRFQRNLALMLRDREQNPDRMLGKFLWIRDLALMCRFDLENTGGMISPDMQRRAQLGLDLWEDTITKNASHPQVKRMVTDHLQFYDTLVNVMDKGFTFKLAVASGPGVGAPQLSQVPELSSRFLNKRHLDMFLSIVVDREVEHYEDKYL